MYGLSRIAPVEKAKRNQKKLFEKKTQIAPNLSKAVHSNHVNKPSQRKRIQKDKMPVYVYQCKNCNHVFEQRQSFSDDALRVCPQCGEETLRKRYNTVGVTFKGSGFYSTDKGNS